VGGRLRGGRRGARGSRVGPGGAGGPPRAGLSGGRRGARGGFVPAARSAGGKRRGGLPPAARSRGSRRVVGFRGVDRGRRRDVGPALAARPRDGGALSSGRGGAVAPAGARPRAPPWRRGGTRALPPPRE